METHYITTRALLCNILIQPCDLPLSGKRSRTFGSRLPFTLATPTFRSHLLCALPLISELGDLGAPYPALL